MTDTDEEALYCGDCDKPATWIRDTQFSGKHPFCDDHAKQQKDFGKSDDSYFVWEKIPAERVASPKPKGIEFRIAENKERPGSKLVEILLHGNFCAALYPQPDNSLKLISAHFAGDLVDEGFPDGVTMDNGTDYPPIPAVVIRLDPRPYTIGHTKIVRQTVRK